MERQGTLFPFNGPVERDLLIDREDELELLARRAADRVSVRLVAPRRFGKTSLLLAHAGRLKEAGWRAAHVDFAGVTDVTDVARRIVSGYAGLDPPWVRAHLPGLLTRLGLSLGVGGASVSISPRPAADRTAAEEALDRILDLPKLLWERDRNPSLVVFDEFQEVLVARDDLDGLLRSRIQYHGDAAAYVFAGSEPSMMRALFDQRERPFYGQALSLVLGPLSPDHAVSVLAKRFQAENLDPGEALGQLVSFAEGHPQRTMFLSYLLSDRLSDDRNATPAEAAAVIDAALEQTAAAHEALWHQLGASERVALAAIAEGVGATSRALAADHHLSRNALKAAADRLVSQAHVVRDPARAHLVDPLLAEWLRRR